MNNENKTYLIRDDEAEELMLQQKPPSASKVLYEDTEKRDRRAKHFRLKNGNFMAVLYDRPVHKLDPETGKYVEIVRDMKENEKDYETQMEGFKARFPKEEGEFITVEKEEKAVSWRFVPKQKSRGRKSMATFRKKEKKEVWDLEEVPAVRYEKADGDTDFQYDISEDGVKESIVLTTCPQAKEFVFEMKLQGLEAKLSEDKKEVLLCSADAMEQMRIPPAFMVDEKGAYSEDIHYELEEKEGTLFLKLVLDTDWISEAERQYPVVIDPRVEVRGNGTQNMRMAEVCSNGYGVAAANSANLRRVGVDANGVIHRIYTELDLPTLPEGYKITKASFLLHQANCEQYNGPEAYEVSVVDASRYPVGSASFVWKNVKNLQVTEVVSRFNGTGKIAADAFEIPITELVSRWYQDPNQSRCLMLKKVSEELNCTNCVYQESYMDFFSPYGLNAYRPELHIEYTSVDMYADHQQYHTFENGRAGRGSVNLFHGNFMFAHNDMVLNNPKLPVSISHFYRPDFTGTTYGLGWKLSTAQKLEVLQNHDIYAVYTDNQGKRHYFTKDSEGNITDDEGLGLTFLHGCDYDCGNESLYFILDRQGNQMRFDANGRLTKMMNANGGVSYLSYIGGNLSAVLDSEGHMFRFLYENGKLHQMVNPSGDILLFTYDGDLLKSIEYPSPEGDSRKTTFAYSDGKMSQVTDCSGVSYSISYDAYGRVFQIGTSGSVRVTGDVAQFVNTVMGDEISFEYRGASTAVKDGRTKVKTVYKFDENGRVLFTYQDLTELTDSSQKSETTLTTLHQYEVVQKGNGEPGTIKYTSMSAALSNDTSDDINLLHNGFFADATGTHYPNWWTVTGVTSGACGVSTENYLSGKKSYYFGVNNKKNEKRLSQTVDLNCCARVGNILVASAWAKVSEHVLPSTANSSAQFRVIAKVTFEDGTHEQVSASYDTKYYGWQYVAVPLVIDGTLAPVAATVTLDFGFNKGDCYFTNVRLVWAEGEVTTNTYRTSEDYLTRVSVFDECQDIAQITENKNSKYVITSYRNATWDEVYRVIRDKEGHIFESKMKYDNHHNLIKSKDYRGVVSLMTYNQFGKVTKKQTYHESCPTKQFIEQYGYNSQQFLISELDQRYTLDGSLLERSFSYDVSRCFMTGETDLNGQTYQHAYDDATEEKKALSSTANGITQENLFSYRKGYLTELSHHGLPYEFTFDALGRSETVSVGGNELFLTQYGETNTSDSIYRYYASGEETMVTNDIFGNPVCCAYKGHGDEEHRTLYTASYDHAGKLKNEVDNGSHICHNYNYNKDGQLIEINVTDADGNLLRTIFSYDDKKRLEATTYGATGHIYRPIYEVDATGREYPDAEAVGITLDGKYTDRTTKDGFGRATNRTLTVGDSALLTQNYSYLKTSLSNGTTIETGMVSGITGQVGNHTTGETYTYDINGNIETVTVDSVFTAKYYYDTWNRLIREDNYVFDRTYTFEYDLGGNITQKRIYWLCTEEQVSGEYSVDSFQYAESGWKDQLISYKGKACTYDVMGNLTKYGENELEWTRVRKLARFGDVTFTYDAKGMRTTKTVNGVEHSYVYEGDLLLKETIENNPITYYHGNGGIIGFNYLGIDYFYRRNLQGDVIGIYTAEGTKVAEYVYDAWGRHMVYDGNHIPVTDTNHIGYINPIRYRGYYYDVETKLYYCQARYYSPELCRWISADTIEYLEPESINGLNLYCYCGNNPVNRIDPRGYAWYDILVDWANILAGFLNPFSTLTAIGSLAIAGIGGRWGDVVDDWNNGCLNPFNQSEEIALKCKVLSFYKGSTVVRQNLIGTCSMFGTVWAEPSIDHNDLKHEYGHSIQERILGKRYLFNIAIPSALNYHFGNNDPEVYYSLPWERTADWLGGVDRGDYKQGSLAWGIVENLLGPIVIPFYYWLGY